jgi:hypothetical protein
VGSWEGDQRDGERGTMQDEEKIAGRIRSSGWPNSLSSTCLGCVARSRGGGRVERYPPTEAKHFPTAYPNFFSVRQIFWLC